MIEPGSDANRLRSRWVNLKVDSPLHESPYLPSGSPKSELVTDRVHFHEYLGRGERETPTD